ncbi:hypothetical protein ACQEVS_10100 [Streptomyces sp. CA-181903]|uniref:hypothetical protein n=1 Tax=Streptomyces sp. CA-181903 TaxID=3240055 RepID=UPI003D8E2320
MVTEGPGDEDETEYGLHRLEQAEPPTEPSCWPHNGNSCDCEPAGLDQYLEGELEYSTEPPFEPGARYPSNDPDLWPRNPR